MTSSAVASCGAPGRFEGAIASLGTSCEVVVCELDSTPLASGDKPAGGGDEGIELLVGSDFLGCSICRLEVGAGVAQIANRA